MRKNAIGIGGKTAIGKEHRLDPTPELIVGQKQPTVANCPTGSSFRHVSLTSF